MCLTGEQDIAADSAEPIAQSQCGHHPQDLQDQRPGMCSVHYFRTIFGEGTSISLNIMT